MRLEFSWELGAGSWELGLGTRGWGWETIRVRSRGMGHGLTARFAILFPCETFGNMGHGNAPINSHYRFTTQQGPFRSRAPSSDFPAAACRFRPLRLLA